MIKAVLFDFDFTLADASVGIIQCVNKGLHTMGHKEVAGDVVKGTIGLPLEDMFTAFTGDSSPSSRETFRTLFVAAAEGVITENTRFFDDALSVLEKLKDRGLVVGIVTTKYRHRIEEVLARDHLTGLIDLIIGGDDVKKHKPHPEGLLMALGALDLNQDEVVFVGDTFMDQGAALAAGVPFRAVLNGTTTREAFRANGLLDSQIHENLTEVVNHLF